MIALAVGIGPCVPGFLGTIGVRRGRSLLDLALSLRLVHQLRAFGRLYLILMAIAGPQPAAENSVSIQNG